MRAALRVRGRGRYARRQIRLQDCRLAVKVALCCTAVAVKVLLVLPIISVVICGETVLAY